VPDAVVVGAGPNGLTAAVLLARAGWTVEVLERSAVAGGAIGTDTTARGYLHDWGSAFYGVLHTSPVLRELGLDRRVDWAHTPTPVGTVWPGGAAVLRRTVDGTAAGLGADGDAWRGLVDWWHRLGQPLFGALMGPPGSPAALLRAASRLTGPREGLQTVRMLLEPLDAWVRQELSTDAGRMLVAAHATHADVAVDGAGSTPPALLLAMAAQAHGMPVPVGGAQRLAAGMVEAAEEVGVVVRTDVEVTRVVVRGGRAVGVVTADGTGMSARRAVVADVAPGVLARDLVGEQHLPGAWLRSLQRHRYASGYFRLDLDLDRPAPWADERLADSAVVHVTGDLHELALAQAQVRHGLLPDAPQLIVGQQDRADPTRVPPGAAGLWVECHCPAEPRAAGPGWEQRFADRLVGRLERHAPGLREAIVEQTVNAPYDLQRRNPNLVGGDVSGGSSAPDQLLVLRPVAGWSSYRLPVKGLWMCGAASHPGGGVHGMCGRNAARAVLRASRVGW
jgi:phytoene dehydrogenase-like protein